MPRWPSISFYTKDWLANGNLKRCTFEEKGVWIDLLCLLNQQEDEYGVIRWSLEEIAQTLGSQVAILQSLVRKRVLKGADPGEVCAAFTFTPTHARKEGPTVVLIPEQPGPIWYSSRMVRDWHKAQQRRNSGTEADFEP